jgi:hypothetical protein
MEKPDFSKMTPSERAMWRYKNEGRRPRSSTIEMEQRIGRSLADAFSGRKYDTVARCSGIAEE